MGILDSAPWLALIPPLLAIILAIWTKRVILSLFLGVLVGVFIYSININTTFFTILETTLVDLTEVMVGNLTDDWNGRVLLFTVLLGGLLGIMYSSGGSQAFGKWAAGVITNRKSAMFGTWVLGVLIFFDDYFNTLTVGSVMRNITDRFQVSREKLAYIIDSTAAPICIVIPISTWIAYVISLYVAEFERLGVEISPFRLFLQTIPFNFYAIAAIVMVVYLSVSNLEFGPMARAEKRAIEKGELFDPATKDEIPGQDITNLEISGKGTIWDLLVPIIVLIGATILGIVYTGGILDLNGEMTFLERFVESVGEADAATALIYGTLLANIVGIIMYTSRRVLSVKDCMENLVTGMKAMVPALAILILAWSIGEVADMVGTGAFVADFVSATIPPMLIPFVIFLTAAGMAFSTGTSWGTFAIMLPIAVPVAVAVDLNPAMCIAAVLGGAIFGDHSSPISDTTVLSSTGAACNHMDHVNTQLPYAIVAAVVSAVGYLLAAVMNMAVIPLIIVLALVLGVFYVLHRRGETVEHK